MLVTGNHSTALNGAVRRTKCDLSSGLSYCQFYQYYHTLSTRWPRAPVVPVKLRAPGEEAAGTAAGAGGGAAARVPGFRPPRQVSLTILDASPDPGPRTTTCGHNWKRNAATMPTCTNFRCFAGLCTLKAIPSMPHPAREHF